MTNQIYLITTRQYWYLVIKISLVNILDPDSYPYIVWNKTIKLLDVKAPNPKLYKIITPNLSIPQLRRQKL